MMTSTAAPAAAGLAQFVPRSIIGRHDMCQLMKTCLFAFTDVQSVVRSDFHAALAGVSATASPAAPDGVRILNDIAVEAVQQLEHASLIAPAFWYSGNIWYFGYRSTRAGRTAVEQGTVEQIVTRQVG